MKKRAVFFTCVAGAYFQLCVPIEMQQLCKVPTLSRLAIQAIEFYEDPAIIEQYEKWFDEVYQFTCHENVLETLRNFSSVIFSNNYVIQHSISFVDQLLRRNTFFMRAFDQAYIQCSEFCSGEKRKYVSAICECIHPLISQRLINSVLLKRNIFLHDATLPVDEQAFVKNVDMRDRIWDISCPYCIATISNDLVGCDGSLVLSHKGLHVAVVTPEDIQVWSVNNPEKKIFALDALNKNNPFKTVKFCGNWLYVKNEQGFSFWPFVKSNEIATHDREKVDMGAAFKESCFYAYTIFDDGTFCFENDALKQKSITLIGHIDRVESVTYSPCERFILSGARDQTLKLWDARSSSCLQTIYINKNAFPQAVTFSGDGRRIGALLSDGTILVFVLQPCL